jgi:hypothetical protein
MKGIIMLFCPYKLQKEKKLKKEPEILFNEYNK